MSTFLSRYLDSLTITPGSGRIPGRARVGYSFGERYWASLTRAKLPPRTMGVAVQTSADPSRMEVPSNVTLLDLGPKRKDPLSFPPKAADSQLTVARVKLKAFAPVAAAAQARPGGRIFELAVPTILLIAALMAVLTAGLISPLVYLVLLFAFEALFALTSLRYSKMLRSRVFVRSLAIGVSVAALSTIAVTISSTSPVVVNLGNSAAIPGQFSPTPLADRASILSPRNGATGIQGGKNLRVSGTVRNIPAGHHLWLFALSSASPGLHYGNPDFIVRNGRWTGTIRMPYGDVILFLADLDPGAYKRLSESIKTGIGPVPSYSTARQFTPLASISITTKPPSSGSKP